MNNSVVLGAIEKLQRLDEERVDSSRNLLESISARYPDIAMTWDIFLSRVRPAQISRATVPDELFKAYPDFFKKQGITDARDVWKKWLPKDMRPALEYKNRLSLNDVIELIKATGAKFAMAHPEEVFAMERKENKSGTIESYFLHLVMAMEFGDIPVDSILGIAYYSAKLQNPLERNTIRHLFWELCEKYPFLDRDNIFLLAESDGHGKGLTGPVGRGIDYPANSTKYRKAIYKALRIIE